MPPPSPPERQVTGNRPRLADRHRNPSVARRVWRPPARHHGDMALTVSPSTPPVVADTSRWAGHGAARWWSQLVRFSGIGVVMTAVYLVLYQVLRPVLGDQGANLVAWVLTAVIDTSANRRLTFGIHGRAGAGRAQGQGMLVFALGLALTSGSL